MGLAPLQLLALCVSEHSIPAWKIHAITCLAGCTHRHLVLAPACSDDGGTPPPENEAPVAAFVVPACTINVACDFVSTSTDDVEVTEWSWDFDGDGTPDAGTASASFTYASAGSFEVSLTVHDAEGLSQTKTSSITIDPAEPENTPPDGGLLLRLYRRGLQLHQHQHRRGAGHHRRLCVGLRRRGYRGHQRSRRTAIPLLSLTDFTVTLTVTDDEGATDVAHADGECRSPRPAQRAAHGRVHPCLRRGQLYLHEHEHRRGAGHGREPCLGLR